jgi:hypothetical protein
MKSAAENRKKLKRVKNDLAVIAQQVHGQVKLDTMLMKYDEPKRKVIFKAMRPFLRFDAVFPTDENTAIVTPESFAKLREEYGKTDDRSA